MYNPVSTPQDLACGEKKKTELHLFNYVNGVLILALVCVCVCVCEPGNAHTPPYIIL